ncbi:hypothetical protein IJZ97_03890 [bacterium]|nr:hypothetical protein [bacterium]
MSKYGISKCMTSDYGTDDYWAGAVELCGGTSKMAKESDLTKIANYVYNRTDISADYIDGLTFDPTKATELGLPSPNLVLWSGEEYSEYRANYRAFNSDHTAWNNYNRNNSDVLVVCLGD